MQLGEDHAVGHLVHHESRIKKTAIMKLRLLTDKSASSLQVYITAHASHTRYEGALVLFKLAKYKIIVFSNFLCKSSSECGANNFLCLTCFQRSVSILSKCVCLSCTVPV